MQGDNDKITMDDVIRLNQDIIDSLTKVLNAGDWDASLFLRNASKDLIELKAEAEALQAELGKTAADDAGVDEARPSKPGFIEVYISIYQAEGSDIQAWQQRLRALPEYSLSRPIYGDETHVEEWIRGKLDPRKEAYAVVLVPEDALTKAYAGKLEKDRFGHPLLTLKDGAIKQENIIEMVHAGSHYRYQNSKLIKL
mgnify:CR=1 FL=1